VDFADRGTRDLYNGVDSKAARKIVPAALHQRALDKLTLLDAAASLNDLRVPPSNRLEALKGDRAGQYSIRINDQYRICFRWTDHGPVDIEIVDYH
jgi:proteic killer suppression protein